MYNIVVAQDENWPKCGAYEDAYPCTDIGFQSPTGSTASFYTAGDFPANGTQTLYNVGTLTAPASGATFTFTYAGTATSITARSVDATPTASPGGSGSASGSVGSSSTTATASSSSSSSSTAESGGSSSNTNTAGALYPGIALWVAGCITVVAGLVLL